jgi:hypothetical protein
VRLIVSVAALIAVTFGFMSTASADPPSRQPNDLGSSRFSGLCTFDVQIDILVNNEYATTFASGQIAGQTLITGALQVRVTRLLDGLPTNKSVDLNVPGPIQVLANGGVVSVGPSLWTFTDAQPGLPRLAVTYGRLEAVFDPTFRVTRVTGRVVDVCALLS